MSRGMEEALRRIAEAHRTRSPALDLTGLGLEELPAELWALTWLEELLLWGNRLAALPPEIGQLQDLRSLDLAGNQLTALPPEIGQLQDLRGLDLAGNQLTALPPEITQLQSLQSLFLSGNQLSALPPEIVQLQNLKIFDLSRNQFTILPPEIIQLKNLQSLDLGGNQLTALPPEIIQLQSLQSLDLGGNQLTALPPEIIQLQSLQSLDLGGNQLTALPPEITQLQNLQSLDLRGNQLTALPPEIGQLQNLQSLDLSFNQLTALPPEITQLQNLQSLDLEGNQLTALPPEIGQLQNLQSLDLSFNQLTALPPEFGQLHNLRSLRFWDNHLTALPIEIIQLHNLQHLSLAGNHLTVLPPEIAQLQNLQSLNLWDNDFTDLPSAIAQLRNLRELYLEGNQLTVLFPEIVQLQTLQSLDLARNQLTALSPEIGQLQRLQELDLRGNQLTTLPPEIAQLQNLQSLDLSHNQLTALPPEVARLRRLERLNLHGNPLTLTLPRRLLGHKILGGDAQAILRFYRAVWEKGRPWGQVRVLFVGQPGVGKTSLVRRLKDGTFRENEPSTLTVETHRWRLGAGLTSRIWDFGGQDFMHATHPFFFSQRCVYVLVLNVRHDPEENRVRYWLNLIRAYGGDSPVVIVGNHADADQHTLDLPFHALRREYPNIQTYIATSARDGTGLPALQGALETAARNLPHVRVRFATAHLAVRDALEAEKGRQDIIPWARYRAICREQGIEDEQDQDLLLDLLHDLGVVLAFRNEQGEPLVPEGVLNPNWVTEAVYRMLTDREVRGQTWGRVDRRLVNRILAGYRPWHRDLILKLMQQFELAYPGGDGVWWIPSVMRQDEPAAAREDAWEDALVFEYEYEPDFYDSIITRFIVRAAEHLEAPDRVWRYGVILRSGENRVLVRADKGQKRVEIRVAGRPNTRREALAFVRQHFDAIHATFARGKGETAFRATAYIRPAAYPGLRLSYDELLTLEKDGILETHRGWQGRTARIRVREVLDGFVRPQERLEELKRRFPDEARRIERHYQNIIVYGNVERSVLTTGRQNVVHQEWHVHPALGPEVAQALAQLTQAVQAMLPHLDAERRDEVLEDLRRLEEELQKPKPRRKWWQVSLDDLREAAQTVGEVGKPVLEVALLLLKLLGA